MIYTIRDFARESKFSQVITWDALKQVLPPEVMTQVLHDTGRVTQRERKLNLVLTVWALIGQFVWACSLARVLRQVVQGVRLLWAEPDWVVPQASALSYRRQQLGVRPLALLCRRVCHPLAQATTAGAFRFGLRLVALDGTVDAVADTHPNATVFGRAKGKHGTSAYPQVRGVHLVECGTHALVDATFWPYAISERRGAERVMRSVQPGWLVLWDAGFHSCELIYRATQRGAHVLARLPAHVKPEWVETLADGTWLADLRPAEPALRRTGLQCRVRIIEYQFTEPALPKHHTPSRLVTTLLDPVQYPALDSVETFLTRWEFEVSLDEIETHQRLSATALRGQSPRSILQELYALVIAHYAIRALMTTAADQAHLAPTRLSFMHAIDIIRHALVEFQLMAPTSHPILMQRLLRDLAAARLPARRFRIAPRLVKCRVSKFLRKTSEQPPPAKPAVKTFRQCLALI
jgi:hypothetical protein